MAVDVQGGARLADLRFELYPEGFRELERQLSNLGKNFPKAKIRQAANKGVNLPLRKAKQNAPVATGELKRGIVKVEEKKWKRNRKLKKAVFQIYFDAAKNEIFQKPISEEGRGSRGGQTRIPWAYYPISQEWGWHVREGVRVYGKKPHFMREAFEATQTETITTVVDSLIDSIQQIIERG
jgi:hypothetical protein